MLRHAMNLVKPRPAHCAWPWKLPCRLALPLQQSSTPSGRAGKSALQGVHAPRCSAYSSSDAAATKTARYQRPLSKKEKAELRKKGQNMVRERKMKELVIGKAGLTHNVLASIGDMLATQELIKVVMGKNCDGDLEQIMEVVEQQTDGLVVHQIGFTFTLYRQRGLPRVAPSPEQGQPGPEAAAVLEAAGQPSPDTSAATEDSGGRPGATDPDCGPGHPESPPAFSVLP